MAIDPDCQISVLYVEDDRETRDNLAEIISHLYPGVCLFLADNGAQGLESFKQHGPDIVITDINMPITSGLRMAAAIKSISPATEIIALTAYNNTNFLMEAIETGISHYLLKPIDINQVLDVISKALASVRAERVIAGQHEVILNLNAELARKAADLESANQELQTFSYSVAHDLRSPLANISDYAQLLLNTQASRLDQDGQWQLEVVNREANRMKVLIGALLKFSLYSQKYLQKKPTDLAKIAREIYERLLAQQPQRRVSFSMAQEIHGFCDPELLRIALENLFGNAWKFTAKKEQARVEFGTISKEEDLVYFIRDNGEGFDVQEPARLFVPFQRLHGDQEFEGLGIGLATAAKIIQRHGGRIWAEGEKGKGATFFFTL
jgi:signal transduction histidine kinase